MHYTFLLKIISLFSSTLYGTTIFYINVPKLTDVKVMVHILYFHNLSKTQLKD